MSVKEYIVTLHKHEDLDSFYEDMETPGGNLHIPDRAVDIADNRDAFQKICEYYLTDQEADLLNNHFKWKTTMPPNWKDGDDPMERLYQAGIKI